jgi:NAD(P)H dehydrogenase (quinone)
MAKVLVVYDSRSGNTEKMAFAVAEGVKAKKAEAIVKKVEETSVEDLVDHDAIIMGSPTYYGQMSGKLKELVDKSVEVYGKLEGKVGGAFTSSGGTATGAETALLSILQAMLVHGMIVPGTSNFKHYGSAAVGAPNKDDVEDCRDLGKRVAMLVLKLTA